MGSGHSQAQLLQPCHRAVCYLAPKVDIAFGPEILFLKMNPGEINGQLYKELCQMIFIDVLLLAVKKENNLNGCEE